MSAPNFDKSVKDTALQLRIKPNPAVWEAVAAELNRKRRRRVAGWLFLSAAIVAGLLVGGSQFFNKPSRTENFSLMDSSRLAETENQPISDLQQKEERIKNYQDSTGNRVPGAGPLSIPQSGAAIEQITAFEKENPKIITHKKLKYGRKTLLPSASELQLNQEVDMAVSDNLDPEAANTPQLLELQSNGQVQLKQFQKNRNAIDPKLLSQTKLSKPHKWHASLEAGMGASSMVESSLHQYNAVTNEYLAAVNIPASIAAIQHRPSDIKTGPSFYIGGELSRDLSRKFRVGMGLQYVFLSNRITIGQAADSSTLASYFDRQTFNVNNAAYKAAGNAGETYFNQFHFVQLGIQVGWNIDNKQRWWLSAGGGLGYLLSAKTLQYNNHAGIYYPGNSTINKWQPTVQAALYYRVSKPNKPAISVGPYGRYNLNSIDQTNKHFISYGIGAKFQFK